MSRYSRQKTHTVIDESEDSTHQKEPWLISHGSTATLPQRLQFIYLKGKVRLEGKTSLALNQLDP